MSERVVLIVAAVWLATGFLGIGAFDRALRWNYGQGVPASRWLTGLAGPITLLATVWTFYDWWESTNHAETRVNSNGER